MAKKTRFTVVLPLCTFIFAHLDKPDNFVPKGKKPGEVKPKYKITGVFPDGTSFEEYEAKLLEAIRSEWPKAKPAAIKTPLKNGDEINAKRENKGQDAIDLYEGAMVLQASSQYQPDCRDAKRKIVAPSKIRAGDKGRMLIELLPCEPNGDMTIGTRLLGVQLIEKKEGGDGWGSAFGEEEGYQGDDDDAGDAGDTSSGDDSNTSGGRGGNADF